VALQYMSLSNTDILDCLGLFVGSLLLGKVEDAPPEAKATKKMTLDINNGQNRLKPYSPTPGKYPAFLTSYGF